MKVKLIIVLVFVLSIMISTPTLNASLTKSETSKVKNVKIFKNCYIEASGEIFFTWQLTDFPIGFGRNLILYWPIVFIEPNVDVTIYSNKNGEILWQDMIDSGQWTLRLFGYRGFYNNDGSTIENLIANLEGKASLISISI